jgi:hypothetical protein
MMFLDSEMRHDRNWLGSSHDCNEENLITNISNVYGKDYTSKSILHSFPSGSDINVNFKHAHLTMVAYARNNQAVS